MVKKRGSNKMTYRPLKNSNMIGAGKKESVEQILKRGSDAKPPNKAHVEHIKSEKKPNKDPKLAERLKELDKMKAERGKSVEKPKQKTQQKPKPKAPTKGR